MESQIQRKRIGRPAKQQSPCIATQHSETPATGSTDSSTCNISQVYPIAMSDDALSSNDMQAACNDPENNSSNSPLPAANIAECRRSSRKKFIKFDVRDLLNKNRKSHKIQIEARIDSNAPQQKFDTITGDICATDSNSTLSSKQKTFIEKSAIFRRYSISEQNKMNIALRAPVMSCVLPPPLPPKMTSFIQNSDNTDSVGVVISKDPTQARRLSRTQEIFNASMMKSKQISSLIVTQMESNSTENKINLLHQTKQSMGRRKTQVNATGISFAQKALRMSINGPSTAKLIDNNDIIEPTERRGRGRPKKNKTIAAKNTTVKRIPPLQFRNDLPIDSCDLEVISIDSNSNDNIDIEVKSNTSSDTLSSSQSDNGLELNKTIVKPKSKLFGRKNNASVGEIHASTSASVASSYCGPISKSENENVMIRSRESQLKLKSIADNSSRNRESTKTNSKTKSFATSSSSSSSRTTSPSSSTLKTPRKEKIKTASSLENCCSLSYTFPSRTNEDSGESFPSEMIVAAIEEVSTEIALHDTNLQPSTSVKTNEVFPTEISQVSAQRKENRQTPNISSSEESDTKFNTETRTRISSSSSSGSSNNGNEITDSSSRIKLIPSSSESDVERRKLRVSLKRMLFSSNSQNNKKQTTNLPNEKNSVNFSNSDDGEKVPKNVQNRDQKPTSTPTSTGLGKEILKYSQKQHLINSFKQDRLSRLVQESCDANKLEVQLEVEIDQIVEEPEIINIDEDSADKTDERGEYAPPESCTTSIKINEIQSIASKDQNSLNEDDQFSQEKLKSDTHIVQVSGKSECPEFKPCESNSTLCEIEIEDSFECDEFLSKQQKPSAPIKESISPLEGQATDTEVPNRVLEDGTETVNESHRSNLKYFSPRKTNCRTTEELKKLPPKKQLHKLILSETKEEDIVQNQLRLPPKKQMRRLLSVQGLISNPDIIHNEAQPSDQNKLDFETFNVDLSEVNKKSKFTNTENNVLPVIESTKQIEVTFDSLSSTTEKQIELIEVENKNIELSEKVEVSHTSPEKNIEIVDNTTRNKFQLNIDNTINKIDSLDKSLPISVETKENAKNVECKDSTVIQADLIDICHEQSRLDNDDDASSINQNVNIIISSTKNLENYACQMSESQKFAPEMSEVGNKKINSVQESKTETEIVDIKSFASVASFHSVENTKKVVVAHYEVSNEQASIGNSLQEFVTDISDHVLEEIEEFDDNEKRIVETKETESSVILNEMSSDFPTKNFHINNSIIVQNSTSTDKYSEEVSICRQNKLLDNMIESVTQNAEIPSFELISDNTLQLQNFAESTSSSDVPKEVQLSCIISDIAHNADVIKSDESKIFTEEIINEESVSPKNSIQTPTRRGRKPKSLTATTFSHKDENEGKQLTQDLITKEKIQLKSYPTADVESADVTEEQIKSHQKTFTDDMKIVHSSDIETDTHLCDNFENESRSKAPPKKRLFKLKSDVSEKEAICDEIVTLPQLENKKKWKKKEVTLLKVTKGAVKQIPESFMTQDCLSNLLSNGDKMLKSKTAKEKKSKIKNDDETSFKRKPKKYIQALETIEDNQLADKISETDLRSEETLHDNAQTTTGKIKKKSTSELEVQPGRKKKSTFDERIPKVSNKNREKSAICCLSFTPPLEERSDERNNIDQITTKNDVTNENNLLIINTNPENQLQLETPKIIEKKQTQPEPEEDSDPLKDIEKFIEDGVNLLKRGYKLDGDDCVSEIPEVLKITDTAKNECNVDLVTKKSRLNDNESICDGDDVVGNSVVALQTIETPIPLTNISFAETPAATPLATPTTTPPPKSPPHIDPDDSNSMNNFIRRSDRIKIISQSSKSLVGRGVVRDKERFSLKDDQENKIHYTLDDQKLDLAEVEAKNRKFLKDMEECLSNFRVIKENEYKCERIVSREAKKMICDCFLTNDEEERGELGCGEDCLNRLLMIECGVDCIVKERCTNRRFQKYLCSPCRVFRTEKKGFGIMADVEILPGEFIMEYVGEVIDGDEFEQRRTVYSQDKNKHYYFMALRSDAVIDATNKGNISRFINHSCDPNAETQKWTVNGELRIGFFSRKSIMPGEEITFDYQYQRYGKEAQRCYCESLNCRGWIGEEPNNDEEAADEEDDEDDDEEEDDEESDDTDETDEKEVQKKLEMAAAAAKVLPIEMDSNKDPLQMLEKEQSHDAFLAAISAATLKKELDKESKRSSTATKKFKKLLNKMAARKKKKTKPLGDNTSPVDRGGARKSKPRYLEDPDIDDAVRFLLECGLKNQSDTLRLSRLMVRAKLVLTRLKLLEVLRKGELPCRRLFLDYHGLRLLHGWMSEAVHENDMNLRMALLETLESLPISNKTMLSDSKVLQTVRNWCGVDDNSSPSDDSSKESTAHITAISQQESSFTELQKLAIKLVNNWENLSEIFRIPKRERIEQMKEHEREADRQYKALNPIDEDNNMSMTRTTGDRCRDRFGRTMVSNSSTTIPHRFKWSKEKDPRERNITVLGSSGDRRKNVVNDKSIMQSIAGGVANACTAFNSLNANLSKEQRREMFAAKVARDEAEKRLTEEKKEFETKCRFFGLDPKKLSPKEMPFCVNPATGQWYTYDRQPIPTPPSYAHVQVPVKPKSTDPIDYKLPDKMDLPPLWKFAISPQGKLYYYHMKIRIPQWEPPIKILPLAGSGANTIGAMSHSESEKQSAAASDSDSETARNDSTDEDDDVIKSLDPVKLQAYVEKKVEFRRLQRYNRLVGERSISPRREEDRIYNQIEVRKYKENKEKIRKRKEEIRKRRANILKSGGATGSNNSPLSLGTGTSTNAADCEKNDSDDNSSDVVPIQDYLLSSDEEEDIKAECNNSPLIDKIVQGDKIVDELDALSVKRPLKRPLKLLSSSATCSNDIACVTSNTNSSSNCSGGTGNSTNIGSSNGATGSNSNNNSSNISSATASDKHDHKKRKLDKMKSSKSKEKEMSSKYRKIKEKFRSEIAVLIVQNLKPYRKDSCFLGRIQNDSDFNHLARKLTHFVMIKELKYCESVGQTLVVTESVKNKSREFIKKYMAKYGDVYVRPKNDPEFREIPLQL